MGGVETSYDSLAHGSHFHPIIRFPMTKYEPADLRFALGLELIVLSLHES